MTNGDRIRQMSDEELAEVLTRIRWDKCSCCKYHYIEDFNCVIERPSCIEGIKAYLESEEE